MKSWWLGLLALGIVSCGEAARSTQKEEGSKVVPERIIALSDSSLRAGQTDTVDMGRIHDGERIRQDFWIRNDSSKPLLILTVKTSCGCTAVDFSKTPLAPGEMTPFSFTFDSRGFSGFIFKHITVSTSIASEPYRMILLGEVL